MASPIGETLRAARREQGRSLADAAAETRVREAYLAALEDEDFAVLGGDVYAKGFLRSYAKALGLDPEPLLEAYRRDYGRRDTGAALTAQPEPVEPTARKHQPGTGVIIAAGGVLLLVLAVVGLVSGGGGGQQASNSVDTSSQEESDPAATTPDDAAGTSDNAATAPDDAAQPSDEDGSQEPDGEGATDGGQRDNSVSADDPAAVEGLEVVVSVVDDESWLRVAVDGTTTLEGIRSEGFTERFEGDEEIVARIGNAGAVTVTANGQDQGSLGDSGEVVEVICQAGEASCELEVVDT